MGKTRSRFSAVSDFVLVAGCLVLGTWLFSTGDPLWLRLNPSPLLVVPLLLGGRYGLVTGLVSGCMTALAGLIAATMSGSADWSSVLVESRFLFAALPVVGGIAGELGSSLARTREKTAEQVLDLKETLLRTSTALRVSEESGHRLERQLALHGLEMVSLENELSVIIRAEGDDMYRETLRLLQRVTGLQEAGIYTPVNGSGEFRCAAVLSLGKEMPEFLDVTESIVERALISRDMVTCRELWSDVPDQTAKWVAVLPWVDHLRNVHALLVVRRMSLFAVHWQSFDRMNTICQWVTCCCLVPAGNTYALAEAERKMFLTATVEPELSDSNLDNYGRFVETTKLCVRSLDLHGLPTTAVRIRGAGEACTSDDSAMARARAALSPQDVIVPDPDSRDALLLMPLLDEGAAKAVVERLVGVLRQAVGSTPEGDLAFECVSLEMNETAGSFLKRLRRANS